MLDLVLELVERTIALHYVLDAPADQLVWDVGHQTYAHKILTGRKGRFPTIRTHGGLSGFPKRAESEYDCFDTGHASTSISAALGLAIARDLSGERYRVAAVIGDGSLAGGLAFEGLNHAGQLKRNLLDATADGSGRLVLTFAPRARAAWSAYSAAIVTTQPTAVFQVLGEVPTQWVPGAASGATFEALEVINT